ncbi:MAG: glycosyltransferase family 4 protein [Bacteroidota bacterium]
MKALFLVLHRKDRSPGQRYRHEQYVDFLERNGITCCFRPLLKTKKEDEIFYGTNALPKIFVGFKAFYRRFKSIIEAKAFDVVYIYRDAFFFGTFFERWLKKISSKIIYDFDDAIWLMDKNANQGIFNKLKNPKKTATISKLADLVIVGNKFLATYAKQFNSNVTIIPSTIDFATYSMIPKKEQKRICIGWTGSFSTIKYFETVVPALKLVKKKYGSKVYFKLIGEPTYKNQELGITGLSWNSATELEDLMELAIGIMPLPDSAWTRGKCGMKALQYMGLEIATIISPIGVNKEIIQDGENGFLASSTKDWVEKISLLIENADLRKRLGKAGRETVAKYFSLEANKEKWLRAFKVL